MCSVCSSHQESYRVRQSHSSEAVSEAGQKQVLWPVAIIYMQLAVLKVHKLCLSQAHWETGSLRPVSMALRPLHRSLDSFLFVYSASLQGHVKLQLSADLSSFLCPLPTSLQTFNSVNFYRNWTLSFTNQAIWVPGSVSQESPSATLLLCPGFVKMTRLTEDNSSVMGNLLNLPRPEDISVE